MSRFGLLSSFRYLYQVIVFELSFSILVIGLIFYAASMSISGLILSIHYLCVVSIPMLVEFLIVLSLVDVSRVPFDYPESESELVSGYNVEYAGFLFL